MARAIGLDMVAGATGSTSEAAVKALYGLPDEALIDMGDFVGGMLKHLRQHPVRRVIIAGGMGKMTKLAQGLLDLHSKRGAVDHAFLAGFAAGRSRGANPRRQLRQTRFRNRGGGGREPWRGHRRERVAHGGQGSPRALRPSWKW